jgi:hypothetical protein
MAIREYTSRSMKAKHFCWLLAPFLIAACGGGQEEVKPNPESSAEIELGETQEPPYEAVRLTSAGALRGTVRLAGEAPEPRKIPVAKDQEVCGLEVPDSSISLGPGAAVENAVVSLVGISRGKALPELGRSGELEIIKCMAVPRVQLVPVGSTLEIVNSDPLLHDIYAYLNGTEELFHRALPLQQFRVQEVLARPGVVHLWCGAGHPWMRAYVVVQEHPYFALTDPRGAYALSDIPPGPYRLRIWHERLGQKESTVTVEEAVTVTMDFELEASSVER